MSLWARCRKKKSNVCGVNCLKSREGYPRDQNKFIVSWACSEIVSTYYKDAKKGTQCIPQKRDIHFFITDTSFVDLSEERALQLVSYFWSCVSVWMYVCYARQEHGTHHHETFHPCGHCRGWPEDGRRCNVLWVCGRGCGYRCDNVRKGGLVLIKYFWHM